MTQLKKMRNTLDSKHTCGVLIDLGKAFHSESYNSVRKLEYIIKMYQIYKNPVHCILSSPHNLKKESELVIAKSLMDILDWLGTMCNKPKGRFISKCLYLSLYLISKCLVPPFNKYFIKYASLAN